MKTEGKREEGIEREREREREREKLKRTRETGRTSEIDDGTGRDMREEDEKHLTPHQRYDCTTRQRSGAAQASRPPSPHSSRSEFYE